MPSRSSEDRLHLAEMVDAVRKVGQYIDGVDEAAFFVSPMLQDAVSLNLLVLGECASRISEVLRNDSPSIPWADIRGLRNRIAHGYAHVDQRTVWAIVTSDLPRLLAQLEGLKTALEGG